LHSAGHFLHEPRAARRHFTGLFSLGHRWEVLRSKYRPPARSSSGRTFAVPWNPIRRLMGDTIHPGEPSYQLTCAARQSPHL
jgi:hypothetical protein